MFSVRPNDPQYRVVLSRTTVLQDMRIPFGCPSSVCSKYSIIGHARHYFVTTTFMSSRLESALRTRSVLPGRVRWRPRELPCTLRVITFDPAKSRAAGMEIFPDRWKNYEERAISLDGESENVKLSVVWAPPD